MKVSIFNGNVFDQTGTSVPFRYRKSRALILYLSVERVPVARSKLLALLWPDKELDAARNGLRITLADIKRELPGAIHADRTTVRLQPGIELESDLDLFFMWAQNDARSGYLPKGPDGTLPALPDMFMDDAPEFVDWIETLREKVSYSALHAWKHVSDVALRDGKVDEAIRYLRHAIECRPWDETTHLHLIQLLASVGRVDEARTQVNECTLQLRTHLDQDPSSELHELARSIAERPIGARGMPKARANPFGVLGRTKEFIAIERALTGGNARSVTVAGAPGIGSSTLAWAAARLLAPRFPRGVTVVSTKHTTDVHSLATTVQTQLPVQHALPTLVLIDDVPNLSWLSSTLVSLCSKRDDLYFLAVGRGSIDQGSDEHITLRGLPVRAAKDSTTQPSDPAAELVLRVLRLAGSEGSDTLTSDPRFNRVIRQTGGHPVALIHVGHLIATEGLAFADQHIEEAMLTPLPEPAPTSNLATLFRPVIASLPAEARETLDRLAVFRGPFERAVARRVTGLNEARLARDLTTLQKQHLVEFEPSPDGSAVVRMTGSLGFVLRSGETTLPRELLDAHAGWIDRLLDESAPEALRHGQQHVFERMDTLLDDVDAAIAFLSAEERGTEALRIATNSWRFHDMAGLGERCAIELRRLLETFSTTVDPLVRSDACTALGSLLLKSGALDEARAAYREGLALREPEADVARIASSLNNLAVIDGMTGAFVDAAEKFQQVFQRATEAEETWIAAAALVNRGHALTEAGEYLEALNSYRRGAGSMHLIGDLHGRLGALLGVIHASAATLDDSVASSAVVEWLTVVSEPGGVRDIARLELPARVTVEKLRTFGYGSLAERLENGLNAQIPNKRHEA